MSLLHLQHFVSPGLEAFDLALEHGECIALSGPSGCGKTRLLRAIADLDPNQGEVRLDQTNREQIPPTEWHRQVGYIPAESHWWGDRVRDHFSDADNARFDDLLLALGFDTATLNWEVARLSSGERQRLALARQLARQPRVLLLDEPTANLDGENIRRVEQLLEHYRTEHKTALLWVSHDPEQRRRVAQRALRFDQGRLEVEAWS